VLVDDSSLVEVFALADPNLGKTVDQQVVNLSWVSADLKTEVMERRPMRRAPKMELNLSRCLSFCLSASLNVLELLDYSLALVGIQVESSQ
jgi:hypothetical protein